MIVSVVLGGKSCPSPAILLSCGHLKCVTCSLALPFFDALFLQNIEADFNEMNQFHKEFCGEEEEGEGEDVNSEVSFSFRLSNSIKSSLGGADGGMQSCLRHALLQEDEHQ